MLPGQLYADDVLLMAECRGDLCKLVAICETVRTQLKLKFNAKESLAMMFLASDETLDLSIQGRKIPQGESYKHLVMQISTGVWYLEEMENMMQRKATQGMSTVQRTTMWSCSRYEIGRVLWKSVWVPGLTFGNSILCYQGRTRNFLEMRQREVGRWALQGHGTIANEAIGGDMGWSSFEGREAYSKLAYWGRLRYTDDGKWARRVFLYMHIKGRATSWIKR